MLGDTLQRDRGHVQVDAGLPGERIEEYVDRFMTAAAKDPFSTWFILPTERLARDLRDRISKDRPVLISHICTLDGLCRAVFEENRTTSCLLSRTESKILLARVIEDQAVNVPLFLSHGHPSTRILEDLQTFMNVIHRRKLQFPDCLGDLQSGKSRQLGIILDGYRKRMQDFDLVDDDTILSWTIEHLKWVSPSQFRAVFVYGFHRPLQLERDLFSALRKCTGNVVLFLPDGRDPALFRPEDWPGIRSDIPLAVDPDSSRSRLTGLFSETGALDFGDRIRMQTFSSHSAEMHDIVAEIARLRATGVSLTDIAVALPGQRQEHGILEEVFSDFGIPWNTAVGPRLSHQPVVQFLIGIIRLVVDQYSREDVIRLVSSPFFSSEICPGGSVGLDPEAVDLVSRYAHVQGSRAGWTDRVGRLSTVLSDLEQVGKYPGISKGSVERVQDGLTRLFGDLASLEGAKRLKDHLLAFQGFLERWGIPDLHRSPDEQAPENEVRAVSRFFSRLLRVATVPWLSADQIITPAGFLWYLSLVAEEPDGGVGGDVDGVTVLGIWECVHQRYPYLFIGGLVEGAVPRLTTRLPFINALENARMGTRTLAEILEEEEYYFITALLAGEKTVYLSAPLTDQEKPLLTSAFYERVRERDGGIPWRDPGREPPLLSVRTAAIRAGALLREGEVMASLTLLPCFCRIDDLAARITMEGYHRKGLCDSSYDGMLSEDEAILTSLAGRYGAQHVYSPTILEIYARCPFEFFLNRVIRLEALPEVEADLSARDRGTAVHEIMSTFSRQWHAAGRARVGFDSMKDATDLIQTIAAAELGRHTFQSPLWDATHVQMLGDECAGPGCLERFLQCEAGEENSPLMPAGFEVSFGMGATGSDDPASFPEPAGLRSLDGDRTISIRGRIDRIDLTPDGSFLIYDYKTGLTHPSGKDIVAGRALQLPLYLLAYEQISGHHGIGGGYYTIRREVKRDMVLADEMVKGLMVSHPRISHDFAGLLQGSRDYAFEYIDGIRNGSFPLPREKECPNQYCDYRRICRFDPYRVFQCGEEI